MSNANQDQAAYWSGPAGDRWVTNQDALDRALEPFGDAALAAVAPQTGERALDVGCGCGASTLELGRRVGATGAVTGVDLSGAMVARATARAAALGLSHVAFIEGDAGALVVPADRDLVFSRFGVMFFDDPTKAFRNLASALAPAGRVGFVCWRRREENDWFDLPIGAAASVVPPPEPASPDEPGPFAFASEDRVRRILTGAGLARVELARFDTAMVLGADVDAATDFACTTGPVARLLADADVTTRARAVAAVRAALASRATDRGVALSAAAWIVTASRA